MTLMKLVRFAALIVVVLSLGGLACTQEKPNGEAAPAVAGPSTATPAASPPTTAIEMPPTAAARVPPTDAGAAAPTTAATATKEMETTATAETGREPRASGTGDSLVVLASDSASSPSWVRQGSSGGFHLSPLPQTTARAGSLTVSAIGQVTVAPDEAYVVVIPERDYGISGPEQLTAEDRQDILSNLAAIGIGEDEVEFDPVYRYEPPNISVEVDVDEYADVGEAVVDAIEKVVRRSETFGVRFGLSGESCDLAVSLARREAAPAAEKAAMDLADALELALGEVVGALEYPLQNVPYGLPGTDAVSCSGQSSHSYGPLLPFDSEPEVEVSVGLQVSYRIS